MYAAIVGAKQNSFAKYSDCGCWKAGGLLGLGLNQPRLGQAVELKPRAAMCRIMAEALAEAACGLRIATKLDEDMTRAIPALSLIGPQSRQKDVQCTGFRQPTSS